LRAKEPYEPPWIEESGEMAADLTDKDFDVERRLWARILRPPTASHLRPALFFDRDGCIVEEVHYLRRVDDVRLIPGAQRILAQANARGIPVIVVTNQAGIGRGKFDWQAFLEVEARIQADLEAGGAFIDAVLACPDHPDAAPLYRLADSPSRKPNPGMLLRGAELMSIDLSRSWIAGDRATDLAAGRNAGLEGGVHLLTGYGHEERQQALRLANDRFSTLAAASIDELDAVIPLLKN
jgi:D-glycero-D-manno-heptose 1,7-bisphosphate phosphatase